MFNFLNGKPSLIVGSAPSAVNLTNSNLCGLQLAAINNAWRVREDFDYLLYPYDFPADRHAPQSYKSKRISNDAYMPGMNAAGGIIFCGATMAFAAGYWAVYSLRSNVIGFYACDMIYGAGATHFYGNGDADPLRQDVSLQNLEAKSARLFCWALERKKILVNCSTESESRLVFPRVGIDQITHLKRSQRTRSRHILERARSIWIAEQRAPFEAHRTDYWNLADTPEKLAFISEIDQQWLDMAEVIKETL